MSVPASGQHCQRAVLLLVENAEEHVRGRDRLLVELLRLADGANERPLRVVGEWQPASAGQPDPVKRAGPESGVGGAADRV